MRRWFLLMLMVSSIGCGAKDAPEPGPETPDQVPDHHPPNPVHDDRPRATECNATPTQTGAGCDMEGIQATVRREISPDGGVGRCYRTHAPDRSTGRLLLRIVLAPDGRASAVDVLEDGLRNPNLASCLQQLLRALRYPAPGDVPCTALYPFNFQ